MAEISPWVKNYASLIPRNRPVLDVACGSGRHSLFLSREGYDVLAVDRDISGIRPFAARHGEGLSILEADLEKEGWPLTGQLFAGVIVVNYLWQPLFPELLAAVAPGGVLIYDTFAEGNEAFGHPRNPEFLLRENELSELCKQWEIVAYAHGETEQPCAVRQSIVARRPEG